MKVYFHTLGCRVNQYETDAVRELFIREGYDITFSPEDADIHVVNTCTVTSEADRKSRQCLRKMRRYSSSSIVIAMGCSVEMTEGLVEADIFVGTKDKNQVIEKLKEYLISGKSQRNEIHGRPIVTKTDSYHDFGTVISPEGTRAYIKIEDGCNKFCSYCIIPYARGRVSSRPRESILSEVKELALQGYKEVVLTGIHICSYGADVGEDVMSLLEIIKLIENIDGISRIRLGSLEPMSLTDEFIEGLKSIKKLCPHFHLSLQSGSSQTLKRMNRDYLPADYSKKVELLRESFPNLSLTTDVICGFPGETEEEFTETKDFIRSMGFTKVHVFPFSERKGTKAASMPQVPMSIRRKRAKELINISNLNEVEYSRSFIGQKVEVLLEKEVSPHTFSGYTREYVEARVTFDSSDCKFKSGEIVTGVCVDAEGSKLIISQKC